MCVCVAWYVHMCVFPINMPQGSPSLSHLKFLEDDDKVLGTHTYRYKRTNTHTLLILIGKTKSCVRRMSLCSDLRYKQVSRILHLMDLPVIFGYFFVLSQQGTR